MFKICSTQILLLIFLYINNLFYKNIFIYFMYLVKSLAQPASTIYLNKNIYIKNIFQARRVFN